MQTQTAQTPSLTKFFVAAAVFAAAAVLFTQAGAPKANAAALPQVSAATGTFHEGVDFSRVAATPVSTGATVGAYD